MPTFLCDCCNGGKKGEPAPCNCENPDEVVVGEWDATDVNPCNIVGCLLKYPVWLLEVSVEWFDPEDEGSCNIVDGAFVLTKFNTNTNPPCRGCGPYLSPGVHYFQECCGSSHYETPFNKPGACQVECNCLVVCIACHLNEADQPVIVASATLRDRIRFDVCNDADWWRCTGSQVVSTLGSSLTINLAAEGVGVYSQVANGTLTFLGSPCGGDLDGDGEPDTPPSAQCPVACLSLLSFTVVEKGNCLFDVTNTSVVTGCPIVRWVWSDGYTSIEPDRDRPDYRASPFCGDTEGRNLTLYGIDEKGCVSQVTNLIPDCCRCTDGDGNPCGISCNCDSFPSNTLSVEQLDACTYRFCSSLTGQGCGFIEVQLEEPGEGCLVELLDDCPCIGGPNEETHENYLACFACSFTLADGVCTNRTISAASRYRWRVWDGPCGCSTEYTDWIDLACGECECCDGALAGFDLVVTGALDCPPDGVTSCNCDEINGSYRVPAVDGCSGSLEFDTHTCSQGAGDIPGVLVLSWAITCDEVGYWLTVSYSVETGDPGIGDSGEEMIFLSEEKPTCADLGNIEPLCINYDGSPVGCFYCNAADLMICLQAYTD
jgi:hypothetical protein